MKLSVKSDYAARAVLGLAGRFEQGVAVRAEDFDTPALSDPHCAPELREAWHKLQKACEDAADAITF